MAFTSLTLPLTDVLFQKIEPAIPLAQTDFERILSLASYGGAGGNLALCSFPQNSYVINNSGSAIYCEGWNPIFTPHELIFSSLAGGNIYYYYLATYPTRTTSYTTDYPNNALSGQYPSMANGACANTTLAYKRSFSYSFFASRARVSNGQTVYFRQIGSGKKFYPSISTIYNTPLSLNSDLLKNVMSLCVTRNPQSISLPIAFDLLKQQRSCIPIFFETVMSTLYNTTGYNNNVTNSVTSSGGTIQIYHNNSQIYASARRNLSSQQKTKTTMVPWFRGIENSYGASLLVGITTPSANTVSSIYPNNVLNIVINNQNYQLPLKTTHLNTANTQYVATRYLVCEFDLSQFLDQIYQTTQIYEDRRFAKIRLNHFSGITLNSLSVWRM